ncbi:kinase-like domain-containing protein [Xylariaceae sp. AK1471]|nr:kinase-like domain-containing protein [Xylariaceae sp. AK1471]
MGPQLTTKLPELVRDSRLETILNEDNTVHIYYDRPGRRAKPRRETWKRERIIGSGGNGVVWLEKRLVASSGEGSQARYRAVKQITLAQSRSVLEICKSELEALAKFSTEKYKRCFVQSFGWYEGSSFLSIAMEYCPLGDLQRFLIEHTRLPESDTREIICQVVEGLQFMHDEGFAHRDLKPGNILIKSHPPEDEWWVKICDMGLSKRIEGVGAGTTAVKGTPGTDIWCLGEMTFRMLCGEAAFLSNNDLHRYHQGTALFPKERLHEMGASGPAMSFITSAMLVEPRSRLETHQAFNHEWFEMSANNDPTPGHTYPSHPVLNPSYSEPKYDPYLGAEPSGAWSTGSLPLRPSRTEETSQLSSDDGRQHSEIAPGPSLSHPFTECGSDKGTPKNSQTLRQTPIFQENGPVISTENRSYIPRSRSRTDSRYRTSMHDERPSIACRNRKESSSPKPIITSIAGAPIIHITGAGDAEEDSSSERSIGPQTEDMFETMQKLIETENRFDNDLQPRSSWYLRGFPSDFKQRGAEYRWLTNVAMWDILRKADEIESQGNEKIRTRRKALVDRVNATLDKLELAKPRFDEQEKEQRGVGSGEESTINSLPQSQDWPAQEGIRVEGTRFRRSRAP